jgi:carbon storage regulator
VLVLSRRVGESLTIGENIKVMVTRIKGDKVRIGIEAPREIPVRRDELKEKDGGK